jgi:hypothetical protein
MKQAGWLCYAYEYKLEKQLIPIGNPSFNQTWRGLLNIRLRCTTALKLHGVKECLQPIAGAHFDKMVAIKLTLDPCRPMSAV